MGGPIGCLRGLPAGQRWPEWPELNPQVGRDLALTVRTSEGEDSDRFGSMRQAATQCRQVAMHALLLGGAQRNAVPFERDRQCHR
jgi:hypothetical protein